MYSQHVNTPVLVWPAKTYIHQLFEDFECRQEDLLRVIADRDE